MSGSGVGTSHCCMRLDSPSTPAAPNPDCANAACGATSASINGSSSNLTARMKLPERAGNLRQNSVCESVCGEFSGGRFRSSELRCLLPASTTEKCGLGQRPVLFRHKLNKD